MIQVVLNGEYFESSSLSLDELLIQYGAKPPFAIAINGTFVAQSDYATTKLQAGDHIDVVAPIFGG